MSVISEYLRNIEHNKKSQLERIHSIIMKYIPEGEDAISYSMPTIKYKGKSIIGFDAHKNHIGIYPYSSEVIETLKDKLKEFSHTKGAIQIPLDKPISEELLKTIIECSLQQKKLS